MLRSILSVGGFTLASRITGFIRDVVMAAVMGTGLVADAFVVAQRLPNHFRAIFGEGAFNAAFVPTYTTVLEQRGAPAAQRLAGGLTVLDAVRFVGAPARFGVSSLAAQLEALSRQRSGAEVWVVGAQNAGKSSLINALSAHYYGDAFRAGPVASHVPGTTLGLVRLEALLPGGRSVVDTPGTMRMLLSPSMPSDFMAARLSAGSSTLSRMASVRWVAR